MASARAFRLIQGFDGRALRFGSGREGLIAGSEMLVQRAAKLAKLFDACVDVVSAIGIASFALMDAYCRADGVFASRSTAARTPCASFAAGPVP